MGSVMADAVANLRKQITAAAQLGERDTTMNIDDVAQVEKIVASGKYGRADFHGALTTLAKREQRDGETQAGAYARVAREHTIGKKLLLGYLRAPIGTDAAPAPVVKAAPAQSPAYARIVAKAAELRKADPTLSDAKSIATVYQDPANHQMVVDDKAERGVLTGQSNEAEIAPFPADREIARARAAGVKMTAPLLSLYREAGDEMARDPKASFHQAFSRVMSSPAGARLYREHRAAIGVGEAG
jgi:hypothetical protein